MTMQGSTRGEDEVAVAWPLRISAGEFQSLVAHLRLVISGAGPLAALLAAHPVGGPVDTALADDPLVVRALRILTAPRQLLLIKPSDGDDFLQFLSDRELIVRFDVGTEGCLVSAPHEPAAFAEMVCALASADKAPAGNPTFASRRFLDILDVMRDLGSRDGALLATGDAVASLAEVLDHPERASGVLAALCTADAVEVETDRVSPNPDWIAQHAFLCAERGLRIAALEYADLAVGVSRPTSLLILEGTPRSLVVLPPVIGEPDSDTLLTFEPVTRPAVLAAVDELLAPPLSPPCQPNMSYEGDPGAWLRGTSVTDDPGDWEVGFAESLAAAAMAPESEVPDSLFTPGATVEILRGAPTEAATERWTLGLSPDRAVEWKMDGSRIEWRELTAEQVAGQLFGHLPKVAATAIRTEGCLIDEATLLWLMSAASGRTADPPPLPPSIEALAAAESSVQWLTVRALASAGDVLRGAVLLLAATSEAVWCLEPSGSEHRAMRTSSAAVLAEIIEALAPITPALTDETSRAR
jgi:hypothetical protein